MKFLFVSILVIILSGCSTDSIVSSSAIPSNNLKQSTNIVPAEEIYDEMYVVKDTLGNPVQGYAYKITTDEGEVYRGVTNEKGETIRVYTGNKAVGLILEADDEED